MASRLIFHVDVNSAFLSWESARRVREGLSDLRPIPAAIGGDRDKRTGIILAKSIPAKKFGVKTGEPVSMALRKCPDLVLAKPDFRLYTRCSKAFLSICREYAPVVEQFSIDECFLDMSGTGKIYPDPLAIADTIRCRIRDELGFTVNIGISSCRVLAKMASDFEKPDKTHTLFPNQIQEKMWPLPVGDLYSVGASTAQRLEKGGIKTIGALAQADLSRVQHLVGQKLGQQLHNYANGIDLSPVLSEPEKAKGYSVSTTLEESVRMEKEGFSVLLALADSVSSRMRADGVRAYCIAVTIRTDSFKTRSHQRTLLQATDITREIYETACELFRELWDGVTPLRLLGLSLTDLTEEDTAQISLFPDDNRDKARRLDKTRDDLRNRFGAISIRRGSELNSQTQVGKKYAAQLEEKQQHKS